MANLDIKVHIKRLKIDLIIHTILLFLGILIPICIGFWSLTFSDRKPTHVLSDSPREEVIILALTILFFSGIISIIWQIISYFWQKKLRETWDKKTFLIRKITKIYYLGFVISFSLFITTNIFVGTILSIFNFHRSIFFLFLETIFAQISMYLFLFSPIFWLVYYINLWRQFKILIKLEIEKSTNNLEKIT